MDEPAEPEQHRSPRERGPVQPRIGDAERDEAIGYLQEHMAQGRLDQLEFDERLTRAFAARTAADLQPLFEDLPEPRPGTGLARTDAPSPPPWAAPAATGAHVVPAVDATPAPRESMPRGVAVALAAVWPAAILLSVATSFRFWWIWVVAAMVTYFLRQVYQPKPPPDDQQGPPAVER